MPGGSGTNGDDRFKNEFPLPVEKRNYVASRFACVDDRPTRDTREAIGCRLSTVDFVTPVLVAYCMTYMS